MSSAEKATNIRHEKADVNVFRLELARINDDVPLATGDPFACDHCGALLSKDSVIKHMTPRQHAAHAAEVKAKYYDLVPAPPLHAKFARAGAGAFVVVFSSVMLFLTLLFGRLISAGPIRSRSHQGSV